MVCDLFMPTHLSDDWGEVVEEIEEVCQILDRPCIGRGGGNVRCICSPL